MKKIRPMKLMFIAVTLMLAACSPNAQKSEVFQKNGVAIDGYDPVAFFREQKPVKGEAAYTTKWNGATWNFASSQNLDSFVKSPEQYAPQYGGYCAYGTAEGHKAPTQADTWTIVDDKLYFNYNQDVKQSWNKDVTGYIKKADRQWETVRDSE